MKPYYSRDGIEIYHGDALEVLDALDLDGVAAVITDPPYASGARTEASRPSSGAMIRGANWNKRPIMNDQMTTTGFVWLMRQIALRTYPALVEGGAFLSFIDWRQWPNLVGALETADLRVNSMVVWDKRHMGMGNGFRAQHELIAFASKRAPRVFDKGTPNVLTFKRVSNDDHPSPKPVGLIRKLIEVVSAPGDLILDPFVGGGATLEAAKRSGRRCIGIEAVESFCEVSARRLQQSVLSFGEGVGDG